MFNLFRAVPCCLAPSMAALLAASLALADAQPAKDPLPPPAADLLKTLDPFYKQHVSAGGLLIVASEKVSPYALREVAYLVQRMLANRPDALQELIRKQMYVCVMACGEMQTDLPECRKMSLWWAKRARGLGGRPVSCGEENQLDYKGDPYRGENIFIHEFAHGIHGALGRLDAKFNERLKALHQDARQTGRFRGYGMGNPGEFWAEGVQSWFHCNRRGGLEVLAADDNRYRDVDTRQALKEHLPALAQLLDESFARNRWVYVPVRDRFGRDHLRGYDPAGAPTFRWPKHVIEAYNRIEAERAQKRKQEERRDAKK